MQPKKNEIKKNMNRKFTKIMKNKKIVAASSGNISSPHTKQLLCLTEENHTLKQEIERLKLLMGEMSIQRNTNVVNDKPNCEGNENDDYMVTNNRFSAIAALENEDTMESATTINDDNQFEFVKKTLSSKNKINRTVTSKKSTPKPKNLSASQQNEVTNNSNNNNIDINNKNNSNNNSFVFRKTLKPPPIHIHNQEIKDTLALIKGFQVKNFEIKRLNNEKHTIYTTNIEEYNTVKNALIEVNTSFFTYTPKNEKAKLLVLKGLNEDEDINSLKSCIEESDDKIKITKISQMTTK